MTFAPHQPQRNEQSRAGAIAHVGERCSVHSPAVHKAQGRSHSRLVGQGCILSSFAFVRDDLPTTSRGLGSGTFHSHRTRRPLLPRFVWSPDALRRPVCASGRNSVRGSFVGTLPRATGPRRVNRCLGLACFNTKLGHHVRQDIADVPKSHRLFSAAGCLRKQPSERQTEPCPQNPPKRFIL